MIIMQVRDYLAERGIVKEKVLIIVQQLVEIDMVCVGCLS